MMQRTACRRAVVLAGLGIGCGLVLGAGAAQAQFPPPPGQTMQPGGASPFPPPPGPGGRPAAPSPFPPPGAQQNTSVCDTFLPIRQEAEKGATAIRAASERKASREEVCPLFKNFTASEAKMVKFLETHQATCGVPSQAVQQAKANHAKTVQIRNNVCAAGAAAPRGPSLSDAFGGTLAPTETPKPGRGTFDTLTGSPLKR